MNVQSNLHVQTWLCDVWFRAQSEFRGAVGLKARLNDQGIYAVLAHAQKRLTGRPAYHPATSRTDLDSGVHAAIQFLISTKQKNRPVLPGGFAVQKCLLLFAAAETARPPSGAARLAIICCLRLRSGLRRGRGNRWLWRAVIDRCRHWVRPGFDQEAHLFAHG
jgi:hypothetical protein